MPPFADEIQVWMDDLTHDDAEVRHLAIRALGAAQAARATQPLLELLQTHPDHLTRWEVMKALPKLPTAEAVEQIVARLAAEQEASRTTSLLNWSDADQEAWERRTWLELGLIGVDHAAVHANCGWLGHVAIKPLYALRAVYPGDFTRELIDLVICVELLDGISPCVHFQC